MRSFKLKTFKLIASAFTQVWTKVRWTYLAGQGTASDHQSDHSDMVFLMSPWASCIPLCPPPPFCCRHHSVQLHGVPAWPPGSPQGTSWEGKRPVARPDSVHRLPRHSFIQRYSSFCYADKKQQAVTQHPHCSFGRKTTSEWLQKEKYVWVLMAQHVLCLVSDTAKKDVAFGQKASAHQQNTLKAQLWCGKNGYGCLWWCDWAWWCMVWARRAAQEWPCPSVRGLDTWLDDRQYWSAWQTMLSALHQNCFQSAT